MNVGDVIDGKYQLTRLIGHGGMGTVYEARHVQIGRRVALKFLHARLSKDPQIAARFLREAQAAAAAGSEHIVAVTDIGSGPQAEPYLVLEYIEGVDLATLLERQGPFETTRAVRLLLQVCRGLAAAHARGIIHRDLKPDNLMLTIREDGTEWVKVLDFGVAKFRDALSAGQWQLTGESAFLGTPQYMAPEQMDGAGSVDWRADVYSAGVVLYELLAGRGPYDAPTLGELLRQMQVPPPPLGALRPDVPVELEAVVHRAMARPAAGRHQSMEELARDLLPFSSTHPSQIPAAITPMGLPVIGNAPTLPAIPPQASALAALGSASPPEAGSVGPGASRRPARVVWLVLAVCLGVGAAAAGAVAAAYHAYARDRHHAASVRRGPAADGGHGDAEVARPGPGERPAAVACPLGEVEPPGAPGRCCWPGQSWSDAARQCQGWPQCPAGLVARGSRCRCPAGQTETASTAGRCCWPRQAWSSAESRCVGRPICPEGFWAAGEACLELPACPPGKVSSAATQGHCCWPGQSWSAASSACVGAFTCERGFAADATSCTPDASPLGRTAKACLDGSQAQCVNLGFAYQRGAGVERDPRRAAHLQRAACDAGEAMGCHNLGFAYDNGEGVEQDREKAVALYARACELGAMPGCTGVGVAYQLGLGVEQDLLRAVKVYESACAGGEPDACKNLGQLHVDGAGVPQDFAKAGAQYQRACELGNASGCCSAGILHLRGLGLARDDALARSLMQRACAGGESWACDWLADPTLLGPPLQPLSYRAVSTAVEGQAPIGQGAECRVLVAPAHVCGFNCRVRVRCGQELIYGAGSMGYNACRVAQVAGAPPSIEAHDGAVTPDDGDPRVDLWTSAGRATVGDEGEDGAWSATLELTGPEAR